MFPPASKRTRPCATLWRSTASEALNGPCAGSRRLGSSPITTTSTRPGACCRHAEKLSASAGLSSSASKRRIATRLTASAYSASVWINGFHCLSAVKQLAMRSREESVAERDGGWTRRGVPLEELPDPFAPEPPTPGDERAGEQQQPGRRRWPI